MLWVDATQVRIMGSLGYLPLPALWFVPDPSGRAVNGYLVPPAERPRVIAELRRLGVYFRA
ncbi:hypothetical protein [Inmirania thermothiophila]|uniref:Uncharacterized protein n=1 Tax=Inmirania thermothiophila TaxID=1750597 RepID=A0A3N1XWT5_9GAMM|nr:hypothetical protein [Inmirania thermothiophila]ROR29652.1 hypothetical protein EDC57_2323 [Inmirania thermothiophila]